MKKMDLYDLAARMEENCGDWENSEGLSDEAIKELMAKVEAMEKEKSAGESEGIRLFHIKKRYLLILAAVLVLTLGMGAFGDRAWISGSSDLERDSEITTKVDNEAKDNVLKEEEEIYQEIADALGIAPMRLGYLPKGMVLDSYVIAEGTGWAYLNYLYNEKIIYVQMAKRMEECSINVQWDGAGKKLDHVTSEYGYEIEAYCVDEEHHNYGAKILYGNGYYDIFGSFEDENEFLSILRGIFFKNL